MKNTHDETAKNVEQLYSVAIDADAIARAITYASGQNLALSLLYIKPDLVKDLNKKLHIRIHTFGKSVMFLYKEQ